VERKDKATFGRQLARTKTAKGLAMMEELRATPQQRQRREEAILAALKALEEADEDSSPICAFPSIPSPDPPGKASDFVAWLEELIARQPVREVAIYDRVSSRNNHSEKIAARREPFCRLVEGMGVKIATRADGTRLIFGEQGGSGWVKDFEWSFLIEAMRVAGERGIPLVAPCISRFLRSSEFHCIDRPDAQPSEAELKSLKQMADSFGVQLATWLHPDSTPEDDRQFLAWLSKQSTGHFGGRPKKRGRPRREESRNQSRWLDMVEDLLDRGLWDRAVVEQIAGNAGVSVRTVYRWIKTVRGE
jgi:hypothetical protein